MTITKCPTELQWRQQQEEQRRDYVNKRQSRIAREDFVKSLELRDGWIR
jgi:hypothetical protein